MRDDTFYALYPMLRYILKTEQPEIILEITNEVSEYGKMFRRYLKQKDSCKTSLEKIFLGDSTFEEEKNVYDSKLPKEVLQDIDSLKKYDFIFIKDFVEDMSSKQIAELIKQLQYKIKRQVFIVTTEYYNDFTSNDNPRMFYLQPYIYQLSCCCEEIKLSDRSLHLFSIFPRVDFEEVELDKKEQSKIEMRTLNIAYIIFLQELTGGLKAILGQVRELHRRGHRVTLYMKGKMERIIPDWSTLKDSDVDGQVVVPEDKFFRDYIKDEDVVVLAGIHLIEEFDDLKIPIVLWEQGYSYLFGVYGRLIDSRMEIHEIMQKLYRSNIYILSVSACIQYIMKERYNRRSRVVPAFIDTNLYHPGKKGEIPIVLLVGNPAVASKNFKDSIKILREVKKKISEFKIKWICQELPSYDISDLDIEFYVMESQERIAQLYGEADILLSTSIVEAFSLPPLEAMAAGTVALATDSIGIRTYGISGENCIICEQGDIGSLVKELTHLLEDKEYTTRLAFAGRESALNYSIECATDQMEKELCRIVCNHNT